MLIYFISGLDILCLWKTTKSYGVSEYTRNHWGVIFILPPINGKCAKDEECQVHLGIPCLDIFFVRCLEMLFQVAFLFHPSRICGLFFLDIKIYPSMSLSFSHISAMMLVRMAIEHVALVPFFLAESLVSLESRFMYFLVVFNNYSLEHLTLSVNKCNNIYFCWDTIKGLLFDNKGFYILVSMWILR